MLCHRYIAFVFEDLRFEDYYYLAGSFTFWAFCMPWLMRQLRKELEPDKIAKKVFWYFSVLDPVDQW